MISAHFLGNLTHSIIVVKNDTILTKPGQERVFLLCKMPRKFPVHNQEFRYNAEIADISGLSGGTSKCLRTRSRSSGVSTPASGSKDVTCTAIE